MPSEGATIGGFKLVRRIGAGASGQVFEAEDPELGRRVAIKVLHGTRLPSADQLERFRREREALARVDHPHVLRVHSAGSFQGAPYVVTELLPGRSLRDLFHEGPLPYERAVRLTLEIARGLSALHAAGLVHRDVKPANVLLDEAGHAKVADLGLATAPGEESLTRTGALVGTPEYMAPEALRGEQVRQPTADVYSLGVLFYELLAGERPHPSPSLSQLVFLRTINPARDVRELAPAVPPAVAAVCMQALAIRPQERFPDAGRFAEALERALELAAPPRAPALPLLGAVALVMLAALAAWRSFARPIGGETPTVARPAVPTGDPASPASARTAGPDGLTEAEELASRLLAGAADPGGAAATRLAQLEARPLARWPIARAPDGLLAALDDGGVLHGERGALVRLRPGLPPTRLALSGTPSGLGRGEGDAVLVIHDAERRLSRLPPGQAALQPFARQLADVRMVAGGGSRWLVVQGTRMLTILGPEGDVLREVLIPRQEEEIRGVALSPAGDGGTAAVLVTTGVDRGAILSVLLWWSLGPDTTERRPLPTARRVVFAPDRAVLAVAGSDQSVKVLEGPQGEPRVLAPSVFPTPKIQQVAWGLAGLLYSADPEGITAWDSVRGVALRRFGHGGVSALEVSPDGRTLAAAGPDAIEVWTTAGDRVRMAR